MGREFGKIGEMKEFNIRTDDPEYLKKIGEMFLCRYEESREDIKNSAKKDKCAPIEPTQQESDEKDKLSLNPQTLPRTVLPEESFIYINKVYLLYNDLVKIVPAATDSPFEAGLYLTRLMILHSCRHFRSIIINLLLFDNRYRTKRQDIKIGISELFALSERQENAFAALRDLNMYCSAVIQMSQGNNFHTLYGDVFQALQTTNRIFFNVVQAAFNVSEVTACSAAFDAVLMNFGSIQADGCIRNYRERFIEMHAAIVKFVANGYCPITPEKLCELIRNDPEKWNEANKLLSEVRMNHGAKKKKPRYRCSNRLAAEYFGVTTQEVERWRRYMRGDKKGTKPPLEFPQADVSKEEMKYAGEKHRGLHP